MASPSKAPKVYLRVKEIKNRMQTLWGLAYHFNGKSILQSLEKRGPILNYMAYLYYLTFEKHCSQNPSFKFSTNTIFCMYPH